MNAIITAQCHFDHPMIPAQTAIGVSADRPRVLWVDADFALFDLLADRLGQYGYDIALAPSAVDALRYLQQIPPDLVILPWRLPDMPGLELCRQLRCRRETRNLPVIMLMASLAEEKQARACYAGADDYVVKSSVPDELLTCMQRLLVRQYDGHQPERLSFADLVMDLYTRRVQRGGKPVHLSPTGFAILEFFLRNPVRAFTRLELLHAVWGPQIHVEDRTVDVHIRRLRRALNARGCQDLLRTVRGVGYALDVDSLRRPGRCAMPAFA
jgi:two-component system phosphate regulon response regulator PhoB